MEIIQVKTGLFNLGDPLEIFFNKNLRDVKNNDVILIASKIVSLSENRLIEGEINKELIKKESDSLLPSGKSFVTTKHHAIQVNAGIDKIEEGLLLLPENPQKSAESIWMTIKKIFNLDSLGVIICDSRSSPLRRGVTTYGIGYFGFEPLHDNKGNFAGWTVNLVDSLAALGSVYLGESASQRTPLAILRGFANIKFTDKPSTSLFLSDQKDLYRPLIDLIKNIS